MSKWKNAVFIAILGAFALGGCHTVPPLPEPCDCGARACVEGNSGFREDGGNLTVRIMEVDGTSINTDVRGCVEPGVRRLRVAVLINRPYVYAYKDWTLEAGRRYKVRADRADDTYRFHLIDVTGGGERLLATFEGDRWPFPAPSGGGRTGIVLSIEGPTAAALRDRAQSSAARFASEFGFLRDDSLCPYSFYGITRGDECTSYLKAGGNLWVAITYSPGERKAMVIFGSDHESDEGAEFDKTVVRPLQDDFGSEISMSGVSECGLAMKCGWGDSTGSGGVHLGHLPLRILFRK